MTRKEIIAKRKAIQKEIKHKKQELKAAEFKLGLLQEECEHPKADTTSDGDGFWFTCCSDCGKADYS